MHKQFPIPPHFDSNKVGQVWRVHYEEIAKAAEIWIKENNIQPASHDRFKTCLIAVDVQNTFCIPGFELYVGGKTGSGAVDDNRRLCEFIYRNLNSITQISPTMDTHQAVQIFHSIFLVNDEGEHPAPFTIIGEEDLKKGRWRFNSSLGAVFGKKPDEIQKHLLYYTNKLSEAGKYELTVWPYHAMLGGIGHAFVASFEESVFFHSIARCARADVHIKGDHPLTEHYSILGPEVGTDYTGNPLTEKNDKFFKKLNEFDAVIIAGQAKSHCVAWTIDDLFSAILSHNSSLVKKVYILEDCTSPVVVPGVVDYTDTADKAFQRFANFGMNLVRSTDPIESWPGIK